MITNKNNIFNNLAYSGTGNEIHFYANPDGHVSVVTAYSSFNVFSGSPAAITAGNRLSTLIVNSTRRRYTLKQQKPVKPPTMWEFLNNFNE